MKAAVCDIGSNTIKMKIYDVCNNYPEEVFSSVANAKLISYIEGGLLNEKGIALLCSTLLKFQEQSRKQNTDCFYAFATASLRRCKNCADIIETVKNVCNINIDLISGDDEAFLSFSGVKNTMKDFPSDCVLLDMGGGSTEIVVCTNKQKISSDSMGFGSLSLNLEFQTFDAMTEHAKKILGSALKTNIKTNTAIIVGGTGLAINKLYSHYFGIDNGFRMDIDKLQKLYDFLKPYDENVINLLTKVTPDRVTTVVCGLAAYIGIFEKIVVKNVICTVCGIREGYVFERIIKNMEQKQ